jgi:hypothetical protein
MFLGALYVGCSSDDGYLSYELDEAICEGCGELKHLVKYLLSTVNI